MTLAQAVAKSDWKKIEESLSTDAGKNSINVITDSLWRRTLLHEVCYRSTTPAKIVDLMIACGADVNATDNNKQKPMDLALRVGNKHAVQALLRSPKLSNDDRFKGACLIGDIALLKQVGRYCNSNMVNLDDGTTPLVLACRGGSLQAVEYLLNDGAVVHPAEEPSTYDDDGYYGLPNPKKPAAYILPIHEACRNGNMQIVELLVNWGANISAFDDHTTPLHIAVQSRNLQLFNFILELDSSRINITAKDTHESPLQMACKEGDMEMVKILLDKGAYINGGYQSKSPMQIAGSTNNLELMNYLQSRGASRSEVAYERGDTLLHDACQAGSLDVAKNLIEGGADINAQNKSLETPLHLAVRSRRSDLIEYLCDHGCYLNTKTKTNQTALHIACKIGEVDIARVLIQRGAFLSFQDQKSATPLYLACEANCMSLVRLLLEHKANPNIPDADGITPMHLACSRPYMFPILELLLENNADINAKEKKNSSTPLHFACKMKDAASVKLLIAKGANIDAPLQDGDTALFFALANKDYETANFLIESGASVHTSNKYGKTLLMVVVSYRMTDYAKYLISCGVDVNASQLDGITAFSIACSNRDYNTIELLLCHKANPNIANNEGKTPLYFACLANDVKLAELLATKGGNFGELEHKPIPKSTYGAKSIKDAKATEAGKAAVKIISNFPKTSPTNGDANAEKASQKNEKVKSPRILSSLFSKKS